MSEIVFYDFNFENPMKYIKSYKNVCFIIVNVATTNDWPESTL